MSGARPGAALCGVFAWAVSLPAQAGGFLIAEQGAAATGRAAASTAHVSDGSTIVTNPAGIAELDGIQAYAGFALVAPSSSLTTTGSSSAVPSEAATFFVPNAFVTFAANERVSAGIGLHAPFGLGIEWPRDAPGNAIARKLELTTTFISPVLAADFGHWLEGLSIGGGFDIVPAAVLLERDVRFGEAVGSARLTGEALGVGGRFGLLYRPSFLPELTVGFAWRSQVELEFDGEADFDIDSVPAFRPLLPPDGEASTSLTLPHSLLFGVAYDPWPWLNLEVDLDWVGWSSYDASTFEFADGSTSRDARDWQDTIAVRAAAEGSLAGLALRLGYAWDPTPIPASTLDPTLPDGDRHIASAGFGVELNDAIAVDIGGLYVLPFERATADTPYAPMVKGTYEVSAWLVSVNLRITVGRPGEEVAVSQADAAAVTP